jgi:hypothetical protein
MTAAADNFLPPELSPAERVAELRAQLHLLSTEARLLREQVGILRSTLTGVRDLAWLEASKSPEWTRTVAGIDRSLRLTE